MAKHHPDLIMCRKQPGIAIGRLCEKDDGKCVVCDSYVRPCTLVRICDECNYGSYQVCVKGGFKITLRQFDMNIHFVYVVCLLTTHNRVKHWAALEKPQEFAAFNHAVKCFIPLHPC